MAEFYQKLSGTEKGEEAGPSTSARVRLAENPRTFTRWERAQIFAASWIGYVAVLLIGRSLRWQVIGWENWEAAPQIRKGLIYPFWQREIFSSTWFGRRRGIVVITTMPRRRQNHVELKISRCQKV